VTDLLGEDLPARKDGFSASLSHDEWLTPPEILRALGEFDLDPCSPIYPPWKTAAKTFCVLDNGLAQPWFGRVWCNPPYGTQAAAWLARAAAHGNAIALIFARTETDMFFEHVWGGAHAVLFLRGRLRFHHSDGRRAEASAGAPSCLVAYGAGNVVALERSGIPGHLVCLPGKGGLTSTEPVK